MVNGGEWVVAVLLLLLLLALAAVVVADGARCVPGPERNLRNRLLNLRDHARPRIPNCIVRASTRFFMSSAASI